ncbi:SMI1/KNR4 family protein [Nocardioides sp. InS609-2]|uniref:SMI1/KNR4 family protein n=1 Tax=Nocardioides sp. InS609-2 TaxID=2760705 RepID=UPI0020BFA86A|nr:SMI1/KNR4 family protein [Nocardioides sp. InS609-2]
MMGDDVSVPLARIEKSLERLDRNSLRTLLRTGVPASTVKAALRGVRLTALPELEALYGWRDGTATEGAVLDDIHLFPGFYLLSVEDAVTNYRAFVADSRWTTGWLPIFANGGGDFYVLDLSSSVASPVRHFRLEESEHPIEFDSLGALLTTLAEAFERRIFFVDPSGYLEMDDRVFGELAAELNPDAAWWRE